VRRFHLCVSVSDRGVRWCDQKGQLRPQNQTCWFCQTCKRLGNCLSCDFLVRSADASEYVCVRVCVCVCVLQQLSPAPLPPPPPPRFTSATTWDAQNTGVFFSDGRRQGVRQLWKPGHRTAGPPCTLPHRCCATARCLYCVAAANTKSVEILLLLLLLLSRSP
jgi:hypothetical protein